MAATGERPTSPGVDVAAGVADSHDADKFVHVEMSPDQDTIPKNDAGSSGKKNRRRTSPQDHAILEAAYLRNSKPDKVERAEIVSRVELGEKEVQIWFQNRRQNDRRRSKPLQPHELLAHLRNGAPSPAPQQPAHVDGESSSAELGATTATQHAHPSFSETSRGMVPGSASTASNIRNLLNYPSSGETVASDETVQIQTQETSERLTPPSSFEEHAVQPHPSPGGAKENNDNANISPSSQPGSQASSQHGSGKKRALDEMLGSTGRCSETEAPANSPSTGRQPLQRSSSMRLAMTDDGAVKIRTNNEPTPSPPKVRAPPPKVATNTTGLQRSKSAIDSLNIFKDAGDGRSTKALGSRFGRSRDTRTWQFYCDGKTKDALSKQAEAETTGSAISAINLIRSNSSKRLQTLSPAVSKVNAQPVSTKAKSSKPKFSRAKSSMARLQNFGLETEAVKAVSSKGKKPRHMRSDSNDSDKENWLPGTRMSEHALRRTQPSTNTRDILQDNESMIFLDAPTSTGSSLGLDDKVSPRKAKAKGEELDCVQGLLSLSQGNWK